MRLVSFFVGLILSISVYAQVPRQVVVEHFTNTRCSVCANRNPGFYQNLEAHPQVLHMAVHPSSPYSDCAFNQHNPSENDARTNHYSIYGATPRLVVQGDVVSPSASYSSADIFAPYLDLQSDISLNVREIRYGADSVAIEVFVEHVSNPDMAEARLFIGYCEDTVFYAAPNGEDEHYNVFRESLTDVAGDVIAMPEVGASVVIRRSVVPRAEWDMSRMLAIVMLTPTDAVEVLQAAQTSEVSTGTGTTDVAWVEPPLPFAVSPNPSRGRITLSHPQHEVALFDMQGRKLWSVAAPYDGQQLSLEMFPTGLYLLRHGEETHRLRLE
jgi:hypothetical protein